MAPDAQATSLAPTPSIQILSTDILYLIFMILVKPASSLHPQLSTAITLCHVCRYWRDILFGIPFIWNYIQGNPSPPDTTVYCRAPLNAQDLIAQDLIEQNPLEQERRVERQRTTWLRRIDNVTKRVEALTSKSRDAPLTVDIAVRDCYPTRADSKEAAARFLPLAAALLRTTSRWEEAIFDIEPLPWTEPLLRILALPGREFPRLQSFELQESPDHDTLELDLEELGILQSPTLRSLSLTVVCENFDFSSVPVSWGSLTCLSLAESTNCTPSFGSAEALDVLRKCSALISCRFDLGKPDPESDLTVPSRIHLPHLKYFDLEGIPTAKGFASSLDLPSLQTLSLKLYEDRGEFMEWLTNFGHQLEDFAFVLRTVPPQDIRSGLQRLPNVTKLSLLYKDLPGVQRPVDFSSTRLGEGGPFEGCCPKLQEFVCHSACFTEADVLEFIRARTDPKILPHDFSPLERVDVRLLGSQTMDISEELEDGGVDLRNLGLKIYYQDCYRVMC